MKGRIISALAAATLLFVPEVAQAQQPGAIELGALGRFVVYDSEVGVDNAPAIGGRLGVFFLPNLSVEVDWSYAEPELEDQPGWQGRTFISHELFGARLLYTHWLGDRAGILLGAGYTHDNYTRVRRVGARGGGPGGLVGLRYKLTDVISVRLEGMGYHVPEDLEAFQPRPSTFNMGVQAGVSVIFREREVERVVELPPPPPDTVVVEREVDRPLPEGTPTQICLATGENVTIYITPAGDTLVGERRVNVRDLGPGVAFAGEYAQGRDWYVADEPVIFSQEVDGRMHELEYVRSGGEVGLNCNEIMQVGTFRGVPLFARTDATRPYEMLYVPVRPGVWQGYQTDLAAVRG